jgi:hypothetical protein
VNFGVLASAIDAFDDVAAGCLEARVTEVTIQWLLRKQSSFNHLSIISNEFCSQDLLALAGEDDVDEPGPAPSEPVNNGDEEMEDEAVPTTTNAVSENSIRVFETTFLHN